MLRRCVPTVRREAGGRGPGRGRGPFPLRAGFNGVRGICLIVWREKCWHSD